MDIAEPLEQYFNLLPRIHPGLSTYRHNEASATALLSPYLTTRCRVCGNILLNQAPIVARPIRLEHFEHHILLSLRPNAKVTTEVVAIR